MKASWVYVTFLAAAVSARIQKRRNLNRSRWGTIMVSFSGRLRLCGPLPDAGEPCCAGIQGRRLRDGGACEVTLR